MYVVKKIVTLHGGSSRSEHHDAEVMAESLVLLAGRTVVLLAVASQVGGLFRQIHLPQISGYLFVGVLGGPHGASLLSDEHTRCQPAAPCFSALGAPPLSAPHAHLAGGCGPWTTFAWPSLVLLPAASCTSPPCGRRRFALPSFRSRPLSRCARGRSSFPPSCSLGPTLASCATPHPPTCWRWRA